MLPALGGYGLHVKAGLQHHLAQLRFGYLVKAPIGKQIAADFIFDLTENFSQILIR